MYASQDYHQASCKCYNVCRSRGSRMRNTILRLLPAGISLASEHHPCSHRLRSLSVIPKSGIPLFPDQGSSQIIGIRKSFIVSGRFQPLRSLAARFRQIRDQFSAPASLGCYQTEKEPMIVRHRGTHSLQRVQSRQPLDSSRCHVCFCDF